MAHPSKIIRVLVLIMTMTVFAACFYDPGNVPLGQFAKDAHISNIITAKLAKIPNMPIYNISVATDNGYVILSGFVRSPQQRKQAGDIARSTAGVKGVENDLLVDDTPRGSYPKKYWQVI